jgi:hypothetical protein
VAERGRIGAAKINAEHARQRAKQAARAADRAEAYAWSLRMERYGGPAQPPPTIGQCLNGGLGWLEVSATAEVRGAVTRPQTTSRRHSFDLLVVNTVRQVESRRRSQPGGGFFAKILLSGGPQRSTRAESPVSPEISPKEICQTVFG